MDKKVLEELKQEVVRMEAQLVVQKVMINVINNMKISGEQAMQVAQQKAFAENSYELNKIAVADLKQIIEEEDKHNG